MTPLEETIKNIFGRCQHHPFLICTLCQEKLQKAIMAEKSAWQQELRERVAKLWYEESCPAHSNLMRPEEECSCPLLVLNDLLQKE